jgi:hypothetical protein
VPVATVDLPFELAGQREGAEHALAALAAILEAD